MAPTPTTLLAAVIRDIVKVKAQAAPAALGFKGFVLTLCTVFVSVQQF